MIEKMAYVNISGHIEDMDRVVERYLSKYEIQLESSIGRTEDIEGIVSFSSQNPYASILRKAERLIKLTGFDADGEDEITKERALEVIEIANDYYSRRDADVKKLEVRQEIYREFISRLEPFEEIDLRIDKLAEFKFIKYRFGKMPIGSFRQFEAFLEEESDIIFLTGKTERDFIYAFYFVPEGLSDKADSILSSLHFERIWVSYELDGNRISGTPAEMLAGSRKKLSELGDEIRGLHSLKMSDLNLTKEELASAFAKIKELSFNFETRKHAARTRSDYFIFTGWMTQKDAVRLEAEVEGDDKVVLIIEQDNDGIKSKPPTRMRNNVIVKPFEFFVRMYGLPSYNEIDPTPFVALTYTLIFGIMFGDLGQGAVLSLLGLYLKRKKNMALGSVMSIIGVSSMIFGILYGSVFGLEDVIHAVWIRPSESVMQILAVTIGLGVVLILVAMVINIINSARKKDWVRMTLSPNGFAGMAFYLGIIFVAYNVYMGSQIASELLMIIIILFIVLPLAAIGFHEPIANRISGKKQLINGGVGQYLLETVIEMFEMLLSYFTNTVSFVRIGAFALSHAGMMSVVLLLSTRADDSLNVFVMIFGNIFVIALEGLVVGIQVLRLEFYEMFSRFFVGEGRDFKPHKRSKS